MKKIIICILILIFCIIAIIVYNVNNEKQSVFVKINGNLYKQSDLKIDYVEGDVPIGKINKLSEQSISQNDGETNNEYLVGKTIFSLKNILNNLNFNDGEAIVVETPNTYILFEKVNND